MRSTLRRLGFALALAVTGLGLVPGGASADTPATVLFNQYSERCPDGHAESQDMHPCAPSDNPGMWVIKPVVGYPERYTITTPAPEGDRCLTQFDGVVGSGCLVGLTSQQWEITPFQAEPPLYGMLGVRLKNVSTSQCLDNSKRTFGGWKLVMRGCDYGSYQQWNIYSTAYQALFGGQHGGMTWANLEQRADNVVHVGYDNSTNSNPYSGDTPSSAVLPLLCLKQDGRPAPAGVPTSGFHSWVGGEVKATAPLPGSQLTSRAAADQKCAGAFGAGFRMAEFHDASGWGLWANGTLPTNTRFWTAINDQPANPWS
ncbi:RICIN domain-containing protein [Streptomyces sp. XY431]|uniref:RICIN domain-containing protein n=1 Tax=Streptomyces sp. XY431 TaxID=1415562 RepID=UPI0006ADABDB|nr:RICIN domain-containing protein [Streptomyces sp. XY431]